MLTYPTFTELVNKTPDGVLLLEGRRAITDEDAVLAKELATQLATRFPDLRFRSGNATGSDEAFSEGVVAVDASRLQIVAPYESHRKKFRYPKANYDSPESLSQVQEKHIEWKTVEASPKNKSLLEKRDMPRLAAKAKYLIRDTMKVVGHNDEFPKPIAALFYVKTEDPSAGGTGHTIRVCMEEGVPYAFQDAWMDWIEAS